jgi:hypothetical protein
MEESTENRVDSYASYDLTPVGSPTNATGKHGNGVDLEEVSSQYLSGGNVMALGDTDFTFGFWFKPESLPTAGTMLFTKWNTNLNEYQCYVAATTNKVTFDVSNGVATGRGGVNSNVALTAGNWYLIVLYHDSVNNLLGISVNGETLITSATTGALGTSTADFRIGARQQTAPFYADGVFDSFGVWGRVLEQDDVTNLYNSGAGLTYAQVIAAGSASSSPSSSPSASAAPSIIQLVGTKSGNNNGSADITLDLTALTGGLGSAAEEDDIVVLAFMYHYTADANMAPTTSGYTELADLYSNDTYDTNLWVGYKKMGSTPDTSVVVPTIGTPLAAVVQVWRGVDVTSPIDVSTVTATGVNSALSNAPSITPTTNGATVVAVGAAATAGLYISGAPTSFYDYVGANISYSGNVGSVALAAKYNWTSGAVDPAAFATTGGSDSGSYSWAAATIALRPSTSQGSASTSPSSSPSASASNSP